MRRKGDLSINMIIVAAIALLVLVIIAALVIRQFTKVSQATEGGEGTCALGRGTCKFQCDEGEIETLDPDCKPPEGKCCIPKS